MSHWTEKTYKDFLYRITDDFIVQLEDKMEALNISQDEFANKLGVTKGRVSQIINNPGNMTLKKIVEYARTLGMKVSVVAYDDDDADNINGPINSEVFKICWEKSGSPKDLWAFEKELAPEDQLDSASSQSFLGDFDDPSCSESGLKFSNADQIYYADDYKREEAYA
jgi:transcriptional regulator with XRE-family HTH domain